jgi:protein O-GlcNAc transferase
VPRLAGIAELIAAGRLTDAAYTSPAGPIRPVDMVFGFSPASAAGNHYMAHHFGFTKKVLVATFRAAGFAGLAGLHRLQPFYDLWVVASGTDLPDDDIRALATKHFRVRGRQWGKGGSTVHAALMSLSQTAP